MGRDLTLACVEVPSEGTTTRILVATSHLESTMEYQSQRAAQLAATFQQLALSKTGAPFAVLMGDMNLRGNECAEVVKEYKFNVMSP